MYFGSWLLVPRVQRFQRVVTGALSRERVGTKLSNKVPFIWGPQNRTQGHKQRGTWGRIFPWQKSEDQVGDKINLWGCPGEKWLPKNSLVRKEPCVQPLHLFVYLGREACGSLEPPLSLPGSPYGMVSAQALGSSSWMSRTLSMDFWAWDKACLAKLESWDALNQLIFPPQPTVGRQHQAGRSRVRPTGAGLGRGAASLPPSLDHHCQRVPMTLSPPKPGGYPQPSHKMRRRTGLRMRWLLPRTHQPNPSVLSSVDRRKNKTNVHVTSGSQVLPLVTEECGTVSIDTDDYRRSTGLLSHPKTAVTSRGWFLCEEQTSFHVGSFLETSSRTKS